MKLKDFDVKCEAIYPLYEYVKNENMMCKLQSEDANVKMSKIIGDYLSKVRKLTDDQVSNFNKIDSADKHIIKYYIDLSVQ